MVDSLKIFFLRSVYVVYPKGATKSRLNSIEPILAQNAYESKLSNLESG